jgi:hypothetical protein
LWFWQDLGDSFGRVRAMVVGHIHEIRGDGAVIVLGITGLVGWTKVDLGNRYTWSRGWSGGGCGLGSGGV